jgi:hypothetical protein
MGDQREDSVDNSPGEMLIVSAFCQRFFNPVLGRRNTGMVILEPDNRGWKVRLELFTPKD